MNTLLVFENKQREAKYATLDEARKALLANGLAGDYLLAILGHRGVLELADDGGVQGVKRSTRSSEPKADGKSWGKGWPDRDLLLQAIGGQKDGVTMSEVKAVLAEAGEPHGHWYLVHSTRALIQAGEIVKVGFKYVRCVKAAAKPADTLAAIWAAATDAARAAVLAAIEEHGAWAGPVTEALKEDATFADWKVDRFSQAFVEYAAKQGGAS